jgi:integrase
VFFWEGRGWYAAVTSLDSRRIQRKAPKQTERGAETFLRQLLAQRDRGELTHGTTTLSEFKEEWLKHARLRGCRPPSLVAYRKKLETYVEPTLGKKRLARITAKDLDQLYAALLERGLAPKTIAMVHQVVHNLLKLARRRRLSATS